jgi:hypothetical protein
VRAITYVFVHVHVQAMQEVASHLGMFPFKEDELRRFVRVGTDRCVSPPLCVCLSLSLHFQAFSFYFLSSVFLNLSALSLFLCLCRPLLRSSLPLSPSLPLPPYGVVLCPSGCRR